MNVDDLIALLEAQRDLKRSGSEPVKIVVPEDMMLGGRAITQVTMDAGGAVSIEADEATPLPYSEDSHMRAKALMYAEYGVGREQAQNLIHTDVGVRRVHDCAVAAIARLLEHQ